MPGLPIDSRSVIPGNHINLRRSYFNSGVLVIDTSLWRGGNIGGRALDYARANPGACTWYDQDALNYVLADNRGRLDPRWNQLPGVLSSKAWQTDMAAYPGYEKIVQEPFIIHFPKPQFKPWLPLREPPVCSQIPGLPRENLLALFRVLTPKP